MTADAVGGVWNYSLDLARGLIANGYRVTLAVMGPAPSEHQRQDASGLDLRYRDFRLEWMENPWGDVRRAGHWLLDLEQELAPAVIHLNGYAFGSLKTAAPKVVVAHSCVFSWWEAVRRESPGPEWSEYRQRVERGIHSADFLVAPSQAMLAYIAKHYGTPAKNCSVISNGRDRRLYEPRPEEPFIFAAGRFWDRAKNLECLARAADLTPWPVYVAGDSGQAPTVKFLGPLSPDTLRDWLARAAIYCLPARYEPFGLSILEAALSGCALVIGDIPSLRENWDGAALFVPPDDPRIVADTLRSLIDSKSKREDLQCRARRRARRFSLTRMVNAYVRLYETLLRRNQAATVLKSSTSL